MRLRNITLYIVVLTLIATQLFANTNPVVTNVAFTIDGTTVTVTYDLSDVDATDTEFTIYMEVSENSGADWDFDYGSADGLGEGKTKGTGKTITFTYNGSSLGTMKIKVLADDLEGDQEYYQRNIFDVIEYLGQSYRTITIGDQTWFAENLNVGTMIQSTTAGGFQQIDDTKIEKYCYGNVAANCATYGGLYEWPEAMQGSTTGSAQGICPSGWHIPTKAEYEILETYVNNQATKLIDENAKSGYTYTNETGFSALFAGYRFDGTGSFGYLSTGPYFWSSSSTENGSSASRMHLYYGDSDVYFRNYGKNNGFSVRCLKD